MAKKKNPHIGQSFDEFLDEQGLLEEAELRALKEMLADQIRQAMSEKKLSKSAMADRMKTSRQQLDRLLNPKVDNVTLATMAKAAKAVGRELQIALV